MDFQKIYWWPRPVRIRLQGSEPGTVCQSFLDIKKRRIVQNNAAKTKISPVDIPTGRDPRTKQQPTGLIACPASPMDFPDRKYDHQASDFQAEAIWDVIWLADKWATGPWDVTHMGFRCIASRFTIKYDVP